LLDFSDRHVEEKLLVLREMGLSRPESMVYAALVSMGPSHARSLCGPAKHSREEVYRILRGLESKGLVEARLEKPMTFVAIDPDAAVKLFIEKIEEDSTVRIEKARELGAWLKQIYGVSVYEQTLDPRYNVKLLHGRQVILEGNTMMRKAKRDFVFVVTARWLPKLDEVGNLAPLIAAARRGVKIRIITEVTDENVDFVGRYRMLFDIRHHEGVNQSVRLMIYDDSEVLFALSGSDESIERMASLSSSSAVIIEGLRFTFETMWDHAVPASHLITR
jgi:sugar-specific transcriptional regulator TrmB